MLEFCSRNFFILFVFIQDFEYMCFEILLLCKRIKKYFFFDKILSLTPFSIITLLEQYFFSLVKGDVYLCSKQYCV